jgi:methylthioribose-1-phosphate isomerase
LPFSKFNRFNRYRYTTATGGGIFIEDRPPVEMTHSLGVRVVTEAIAVWNPCFDLTPAALIDGIITVGAAVNTSSIQLLAHSLKAPDFTKLGPEI